MRLEFPSRAKKEKPLKKKKVKMEGEKAPRLKKSEKRLIEERIEIAESEQEAMSAIKEKERKEEEERGVTSERIERRFALARQILRLALKTLAHEGKIRELGNLVALSSFELALMPEEQKIMERLEEMCFKGKLRSVSLKDIRLKFHLSPKKLEKLLSFLIERKKVVQGREGFFLHSRWLDDVISNIRELGKRELTVSDFKKMTGLSRKYAIPLLELLDEMQVTRRKGPSREIL